MCGIVGLAGQISQADAARLAARMSDCIAHRGPDDEGLWATDRFAFAMRRLSIIDLVGGHQPMWTDDGVGIVFNGEIYNYRTLRADLERSGATFATQSDTEVILQLYRNQGLKMVQRLEGMFAICIYDRRQGTLHLIRDRFGVKPLYYAEIDGILYFASEIKAILRVLPCQPPINRQALHDYLTLRFVPAPDTVWRGIHKLPPGHHLTYDFERGLQSPVRYWRLEFAETKVDGGRDYPAEFCDRFLAAVQKRLIAADVPVGILLSGGLDSSALVAAAKELGHKNFHTFSVAFADGGDFDETPYARAVAAHIGSQHHEIRIDQKTFVSFLPQLVYHSDEPLADLASVPLYFVCRLARQEVKVVLSGEGSDEVLAGYNFDRIGRSLNRLQRLERWSPAWARRLLQTIPAVSEAATWLHLWAKYGWNNMLAAKPYHMTLHWDEAEKNQLWLDAPPPSSTVDRLRELYQTLHGVHPIDQLQQVYCADWLTEDLLMKADKMSMATSLEIREPFLDHDLAEWATTLPLVWRIGDPSTGYESKRILREFCRQRLPSRILDRPKQGFPVPAYGWLSDSLGAWANDLLFGPESRIAGLMHVRHARTTMAQARGGHLPSAHKIWVLIVLEHWLRVWT